MNIMQRDTTAFSKNDINSKKSSILIIDDSAETLVLQRFILELDGFEVYTAAGGTEALAVLQEISEPSLILLDMKMDDMSGIQFLEALEQASPKIINSVPIVFLTGMESVPKSKAVGFIRKPADMNLLLSEVHRFIEMRNNVH